MNLLTDPAMKEVVDDFCNESLQLFSQLEDTLESFEVDLKDGKQLEKFGQIIDRIMGAAKSIGADEIATFCELGKTIGYKSSQTNDAPLLNVVVAILFDAVDILTKMVNNLKMGKSQGVKNINTQAFVSRLKWLSEKFKNIERSSCKITDSADEKELDQNSIDDLLSSLGL